MASAHRATARPGRAGRRGRAARGTRRAPRRSPSLDAATMWPLVSRSMTRMRGSRGGDARAGPVGHRRVRGEVVDQDPAPSRRSPGPATEAMRLGEDVERGVVDGRDDREERRACRPRPRHGSRAAAERCDAHDGRSCERVRAGELGAAALARRGDPRAGCARAGRWSVCSRCLQLVARSVEALRCVRLACPQLAVARVQVTVEPADLGLDAHYVVAAHQQRVPASASSARR